MENVKTVGVFFNANDVEAVIERHLDWAELVEGQVFCAGKIMSSATPIGTTIIVGVDGMRCDEDSDVVTLILSDGIYELQAKLTTPNDDAFDIRFDQEVPIYGTYGQMIDGVLDILTDEEKVFKNAIDTALGDRTDEYAEMFRKDNVRKIGGRGLILLEKFKTEVKNDDILIENSITPIELAEVFIDVTKKCVEARENIVLLNTRLHNLTAQREETYVEGSKQTKKLTKDIDVTNRKLGVNRQTYDFCMATINAAILPVLNMTVLR